MFDWLTEAWNYAMSTVASVFTAMMIPVVANKIVNDEEPALTLTYFDIKGLAQATRDTLKYGDIPFEDKRVTFDHFKDKLKSTLPYGQLPVLEIDDLTIAQSKTILRYASKKARTYPKNPEYAAIIDQWCDLHTEFMNMLVVNMYSDRAGLGETGYSAEKHRTWILENHIPKYLALLEDDFNDDSKWLGKMDRISMADFCWYPTLCWLHEGTFDGVTSDTFSPYPKVLRFMKEVGMQITNSMDVDSYDSDEADCCKDIESEDEDDELSDKDKDA